MSQSFHDVTDLWKKEKRRWVKRSSYATYVYLVNAHLMPFFSGRGPIDERAIQEFVDREYAIGLSIKTIRDALSVLKMILRFGEKLGEWPHVEYEVHYPTSVERSRDLQVLSKPQQTLLQRHLQENFSFRNLGILICLQSGLRIGEVCALQWRDVDVTAGVLHVRKTIQRIWMADGRERQNDILLGTPKTPSSVRDVPISRSLMHYLRPLCKVMSPDFFLVSNASVPLEPRYYRDYFRRTLVHLGLPPLRFHALRHSFATRCIEAKCDYKTVSAILGHASISTTMDLYVHPDLGAKRKVIERVARGL